MNYKQLNLDEIKLIYEQKMPKHFPKDEIRSFSSLKSLYKSQNYLAIGGFEGEKLLVYAFFAIDKSKNNYLLDYLATDENCRGKGVGSQFLKEIPNLIQSFNILILEVENVDFATNEKEKYIREKRIDFYKKNSCYLTGVKSVVWGVYFNIMCYNFGKTFKDEEIFDAVENIYKIIFPKEIYDSKIKFI